MSRRAGGCALAAMAAAVAFAVAAAVVADLAIRAMRELLIGLLFVAVMAMA